MPNIDKDKLEEYASVIYERLEEFNDYTLKTIAERIKAIGQLSAYDAQAIKNMSDVTGDMKKITKKLAEITEMNIADIEKVYEKTVTDGVNTYKPLYDFKNIPFVPFDENEFAKSLVKNWAEQTAGEMINLSRTKAIGFDKYDAFGNVIGHTPLKGAYEQAISSAVTAISSGTADFNFAMKKTIEELGGSGVKVTYGSGVNRSLSAMIRQNLLYGAKQSAQAYDKHVGKELECDGFEVDAHAGCRPSHMFMQGKMYSYNGRKVIDGTVYEDGKEALRALGDYGCLHFKDDVILGVSPPRYTKAELERINRESSELLEYSGRKKTLYEWKQTQRRFERAVRTKQTQADMFKASGNIAEANMRKKEIVAYRDKYDDLCDKLGLRKRTERMMTYKGKTLTNGKNGGIISTQGGKIMNINNMDSPIEQRNTAKGNPNAILQIGRPLNNRQQKILEKLEQYDSWTIVNKKTASMKDLSAITAFTGDEFALFTKGGQRLVIRGNTNSVNVDVQKALELYAQGYRWSGHTHPGVEKNCLIPSSGDKEILKCFKQDTSVIYNSKGDYRTFEKEG